MYEFTIRREERRPSGVATGAQAMLTVNAKTEREALDEAEKISARPAGNNYHMFMLVDARPLS